MAKLLAQPRVANRHPVKPAPKILESSTAWPISPKNGLCGCCSRITLEDLGYFQFPEDREGYQYKGTLRNLIARAKFCKLCSLIALDIPNYMKEAQDQDYTVTLTAGDGRTDPLDRLRKSFGQEWNCRPIPEITVTCRGVKRGFGGGYDERTHVLRVYVYNDSSNSTQYIAGRAVFPANSPQTMLKIREWLRECKEGHRSCKLPHELSDLEHPALARPSRFVNVGSTHQEPYLEEITEHPQYLALSYRWSKERRLVDNDEEDCGTSDKAEPRTGDVTWCIEAKPVIQTTLATIDGFKKRLPIDQLPKTIQDAIAVTRKLQYRYLWIDRFCIIQDDLDDKGQNLSIMGHVYRNADCVIAATGAEDDTKGCFLPRPRPEPDVHLPIHVSGRTLDDVYVGQYPERRQPYDSSIFDDEVVQSTWFDRGWVFQERFMARRIIHFAKSQVLWECYQTTRCESDTTDLAGENIPIESNWKKRQAEEMSMELSTSLIERYSRTKLTNEWDRLRAFEGIATAVCARRAVEYAAGIWLDSFPENLLWTGLPLSNPPESKPERAPSWSWASHYGPIQFVSGDEPEYGRGRQFHFRKYFFDLKSAGKLDNFSCSKTELHLRVVLWHNTTGPGRKVSDTASNESRTELILRDKTRTVVGTVTFDDPAFSVQPFVCAPIQTQKEPGPVGSHKLRMLSLALQPIDHSGRYRKVGIGRHNAPDERLFEPKYLFSENIEKRIRPVWRSLRTKEFGWKWEDIIIV